MSRIGKKPIPVPDKVKVDIVDGVEMVGKESLKSYINNN